MYSYYKQSTQSFQNTKASTSEASTSEASNVQSSSTHKLKVPATTDMPSPGTNTSLTSHQFEMEIKDFSSSVGKKGHQQESEIWNIGRNLLKGQVIFYPNRTMVVYLQCRCPQAKSEFNIKVGVTAVSAGNLKRQTNLELGQTLRKIKSMNRWSSWPITDRISCDSIARKELVTADKVLLMFVINLD